MIEFRVRGKPIAEGRPRVNTRTMRVHPDSRANGWKHAVRAACKLALIETGVERLIPAGVPVAASIEFEFERPRSHYGSGRNAAALKSSAPAHHTGRPDADNLAKAVLDAVGNFDHNPRLVMVDDSQVVRLTVSKRWIPRGRLEGAGVRFAPLDVGREAPEMPKPAGERTDVPAARAIRAPVDSGSLSSGERWAVWRMRSGASYTDAADVLGVSAGKLRRWERDELPSDAPDVGALALGEACFVRRRREGIDRRELAGRLGLSMSWLGRAERGAAEGVEAVAAWWVEFDRVLG